MPRIALFQDYLAQSGGAERVTEAIAKALPTSDLHATMAVPEKLSPYLSKRKIQTTWMQNLPAKAKLYRHYFLFYPNAVESARLQDYDVVITSCCGYAKGVRRGPHSIHICYCHNPMRWVWRFPEYIAREQVSPATKWVLQRMVQGLKKWEMNAARRPDYYIANSHIVAQRLQTAFGVNPIVIEPPIETSRFWISQNIADYYLVLSRLRPYKRIDLAVEACSRTGRKLIVVGDGPDRDRLEAMAGPTVQFLGRQPDHVVNQLASRCRALLFPGEEDFGMAPLEVNAAGRPAVAYAAGGATETIREQVNGILFREQTVDCLVEALEQCEARNWDPRAIRQVAMRYDIHVFQERFLAFLVHVAPEIRDLAFLQLRAG